MAYSTISKPSLHFNTKLYTGNGGTQSITGIGHQPDLVWIKQRNGTEHHSLYDAVRGATKEIASNRSNVESTVATSLTGFDSDGFTLGSWTRTNNNSDTYASWNWKANGTGSANTDGSINSTVSANTTAGFSIVKWTNGTSSVQTIGHGLGVAPKMIIMKVLGNSGSWNTYHESIGNTHGLYLNSTAAQEDNAAFFNDTSPTSTVFTTGTNGNLVNNTLVAYCFAEIKGYSKFGNYTGNGNANGTFVYTGFKPAWIMGKTSSHAGNWFMWDNKRPNEFNLVDSFLEADGNVVEYTNNANHSIDILSNGFKFRGGSGSNLSGRTAIYMAFAEEPLVANVGQGIPATAR